MKKIVSLLTICFPFLLQAQNVGINNAGIAPHASAILDVNATNKGMLLPRVNLISLTDAATITLPAPSILLYNTNASLGVGFYYNAGTSAAPSWLKLSTASGGGTGWALTGNSASATDFIGTTNDQPLRFKMNNETSGEIDNTLKNVGIGQLVLQDITTGKFNSFIGAFALSANKTGNGNSAVGFNVLSENTVGSNNTGIGTYTLTANTSGIYNVGAGYATLYSNTIGSNNIAVGNSALYKNIDGQHNIALGGSTLFNNISGQYNVAIGANAMFANVLGNENIAIGRFALNSNTSANNNTAIGAFALKSNTVGPNNTALGKYSLTENIDGKDNVSLGMNTLYANTTGSFNVAAGNGSLYSNTTGSQNTAFGHNALNSGETNNNNTAFGFSALFNNTGANNSAMGSQALYSNTSGVQNTAMGYQALNKNVKGAANSAFGSQALYLNTSGENNTAFGCASLNQNTTGLCNTAIGSGAMFFNIDNSYTTAIGFNALHSSSGGVYNTAIGYNAGKSEVSVFNNSTAIGSEAYFTGSNQVRIGNSEVTSIAGYASWSVISDKRFKKQIYNDVHGLDFIMKLKPVTYNMDVRKLHSFLGASNLSEDAGNALENRARLAAANASIAQKETIKYTGFLAQDVEVAANEVGYNFSGIGKPQNEHDHYTLAYSEFVVPIVKAIQEQQKIIEALNNNDLSGKIKLLEAENEALKADIDALKKAVFGEVKLLHSRPPQTAAVSR